MLKLIYFLSKSACGSAKAIYTFDAMFFRAKIVLAKSSINSDSIAPFGSEGKLVRFPNCHECPEASGLGNLTMFPPD